MGGGKLPPGGVGRLGYLQSIGLIPFCLGSLPFEEPDPLILSLSSIGGEGARRAVEGDSVGFMVPMLAEKKERGLSLSGKWAPSRSVSQALTKLPLAPSRRANGRLVLLPSSERLGVGSCQ